MIAFLLGTLAAMLHIWLLVFLVFGVIVLVTHAPVWIIFAFIIWGLAMRITGLDKKLPVWAERRRYQRLNRASLRRSQLPR